MKEDRRGQFAPREDEETVTSAILERPVNQKTYTHVHMYTCAVFKRWKTTSIDLTVLISISTSLEALIGIGFQL